MTVYLNVVSEKGENNFEFLTLGDYWAYFKKYKDMFKYHPVRFNDGDGNAIYMYDHTKAIHSQKIKEKLFDIVFNYYDIKGNKTTEYFVDMDLFKDYLQQLDLAEKPKAEIVGNQKIYTYREDKMYQDFVASKTIPFATHVPHFCREIRLVWIDRKGVESIKSFDELAEFWEFFDGLSCKFQPVEFYDEDDDVMNYIYDVIELENSGVKKGPSVMGKYYFRKTVATVGANPDQRVIY